LVVVAGDEVVKACLLLEHVRGGGVGRLRFQREVPPFMSAVLLWMARLDALDLNAQPQPPDRQLAEAIERRRRREGHPVVGADRGGEPKLLEGALEDGK